jgi:adenylyltransferase/sulfurtransferase
MAFSTEELERYARHIVLRDIGGPGQQRLKNARVLVIGAGGLGAPLLQYLAAAGIGTLAIVDDDVVSLSNLQRQVIHGAADVGRPKVESARDAIARLNFNVKVETFQTRLNDSNARELVRGYDVVADGSDNFETRYCVSDACFHEAKPLVTAAVGAFDGSLTTLKPYETRADGAPNPTYRCLFPAPPPAGSIAACAEAGVLGALTGTLGAMMALEALRAVVGFGEGLVGRLLLVDALDMRFETLNYEWDPTNPLNGINERR